MKCLLVDDEPGIREGMAALLRRRGHDVRTAGDVGAALAELAAQPFDAVITDWRLPDGTAEPVVRHSRCPVFAVSGHPDEVTPLPQLREVLQKPIGPAQLVERLAALAVAPPAAAAAPLLPPLPVDLRCCLEAGLSLLAASEHELVDDGTFVTLRCPLADDAVLPRLEALGGDLRVLTPAGRPTVEWRLFRDARPDGATVTAALGDWPQAAVLAVDFASGPPVTVADLPGLLQRAAERRAAGGTVHLLNVPEHLRFFAEVSAAGLELPKRTTPGPRLAAVLVDLWS